MGVASVGACAGWDGGVMGRPRLVDYDEVRRLYATGEWTQKQLAERFGVSVMPIQRAVNPRAVAYQRQYLKDHRVSCASGCGALVYTNGQRTLLCRACFAKTQRTAIREDSLKCHGCKEWKPDAEFPHSRPMLARRGRHNFCRACCTAQRREYRDARKVPCSGGCGTMVLHERRDPDKPPMCHPCAMRRARAERRAA